jgi:hypothetical protein
MQWKPKLVDIALIDLVVVLLQTMMMVTGPESSALLKCFSFTGDS